jgi:hypothetical protein
VENMDMPVDGKKVDILKMQRDNKLEEFKKVIM